MLLAASVACATEPYDLGRVQVTGKDATTVGMNPGTFSISESMGEKEICLPEINAVAVAEPLDQQAPAVTPALMMPAASGAPDIAIGAMAGQRGSNWQRLTARGEYQCSEGRLRLERERRDGFRSEINDERKALEAGLSMREQGNYEINATALYTDETYAQRGTRTAPTPLAGINDTIRAVNVEGQSTLSDGAHFTGRGRIDQRDRDTTNPALGWSDSAQLHAGGAEFEYLKDLNPGHRVKGLLALKNDSYEFANGQRQKLTKTSVGGDYEVESGKTARITIGARQTNLLDRSHFGPRVKLSYLWNDPWQIELRYDEDLGNDDLASIYLPHRYVAFNGLTASIDRRWSALARYRSADGFTAGIEYFGERNDDDLEFVDRFDATRGILVNDFRKAQARREGLKVSGKWQLEKDFTLGVLGVLQNPEDRNTGLQLSYEAKRQLDVSLAYDRGPMLVKISRRTMADRVAYVPTAKVDLPNYSRADLELAWRFRDRLKASIKVKDLYDEGKDLRYDVPEEGRVTMAGLEAEF